MASSHVAVKAVSVGVLIALGLTVLIFGAIGAVGLRAEGLSGLGPWDLRAIWFTLWQAALSASLSAGLAIPVARALSRRQFFGRSLLVTLLSAPFILPVIVAIMGLIAIFGRNGLINEALATLGVPTFSIYGWQGVVLAHVFFNLPLSVRLLLQGWQAIPLERFRLAQSLGFAPSDIARHLERPMLRGVLPGVWLAVFLVCLTSFAIALTLGGGPSATTIELAIYQAFRFDFDLGRAATLGLVQIAISLAAIALTRKVTIPSAFGAGLEDRSVLTGPKGWRISADVVVVTLAAAFLLAPMVTLIVKGIPNLTSLDADVWLAAARSISMAIASALLTSLMALGMALTIATQRWGWVEAAGMLPIVASPLVLGTGLFLIMRSYVSPSDLALPVTILVNSVMALPFGLRALIPAARTLHNDYARLAASVGLSGVARLRYLTLPRLARPLGFAAGLAAALAMGDLGVIALFATDMPTLPLKMYELMSSYRTDDAAACAVLLMALSFLLFWLFDRGGRLA